MFRDRSDEVGELLDLLGNETRRRILEILADEPKYFIQLSRELGVSQQAVLKHLSLLEEFGLVSSFRAKSDLAAPDRKYFKLKRAFYLSVGVAGDTVEIDLRNIEEDEGLPQSQSYHMRRLHQEVAAVNRGKEIASVLRKTDEILREIEERMHDLEEERIGLLRVKQQVLQKAHGMIRDSLEEGLGRNILYSMLSSSERPDVESLSVELNAREKEVREVIKRLEEKFSLKLT